MKVGLVTSYMPPHLGGIEQIAENLFTGYTSAGVEVRWVASRVPADAPPREGGRIRVPCFNLVEDVLGVPVPVWGPTGWAEIKRLVQWADAIHVLDCLYLSSAMAVMLSKRHDKPVLVSQNIGLIRYAFAPLNWIERAAYATLGRAVLRHASHVVLATPTAAAHVRTLFPDGLQGASTFPIGVDTSRFHPAAEHERQAARRSLGFAAETKLVLFAGRLVEKKGVSIVLDVCQRLSNVQFVVAGDGPLRTLVTRAPSNGTWHRTVAARRMHEYYHAADCVFLASHGEGLPLLVPGSRSISASAPATPPTACSMTVRRPAWTWTPPTCATTVIGSAQFPAHGGRSASQPRPWRYRSRRRRFGSSSAARSWSMSRTTLRPPVSSPV